MKVDDRLVRKTNGAELHAAVQCRYEYRSEQLPLYSELQPFASDGWELVSVVVSGADLGWFYFRRAVA